MHLARLLQLLGIVHPGILDLHTVAVGTHYALVCSSRIPLDARIGRKEPRANI